MTLQTHSEEICAFVQRLKQCQEFKMLSLKNVMEEKHGMKGFGSLYLLDIARRLGQCLRLGSENS